LRGSLPLTALKLKKNTYISAAMSHGIIVGILMPSLGRDMINITTPPTIVPRWKTALMPSASTALLLHIVVSVAKNHPAFDLA
jgi:hypothetical protein